MNGVRRLAMFVAFFTWLFAWSLLRDARARFDGGPLGTVPPWLMGLLGVALVLTIGTAVTAAIRLPVWPWCALASAVFVVAAVLGAHFALLKAASSALAKIDKALAGGASLGSALDDVFKAGALHVFFFIGAPLVLAATGIYGWLRGPRTFFADEVPHGG